MKKEQGFTLVELMVSTVILAVISLALLGVFKAAMEMWTRGAGRLEMMQNARFTLEKVAELVRSAVRTDEFSLRAGFTGDYMNNASGGPNHTTEVDRFVGVNKSSQTASEYIEAATNGFQYGYEEADGLMFMTNTYGNNYDKGEVICIGVGMSDEATGATYSDGSENPPYVWFAKTAMATSSSGSWTDPYVVRPNKTSTAGDGGRPASESGGPVVGSYQLAANYINDLQFEFFDGGTTSGSVNYWDSHPGARGYMPSMVRMEVRAYDPKGVMAPIRMWTDATLRAGTDRTTPGAE